MSDSPRSGRSTGRLDPVQLEVFRHLLSSVAEEMGVVLRRTSYSPNIKERRDYSCAVFDTRGQMIARVWHGEVPVEKADEYHEYLLSTGVADLRATPGNRGVYVVRRFKNGNARFTMISLWDSLEAIRVFAGDDEEVARYYPEDSDYLIELAPTVSHYDVLTAITDDE